MLRESIETCNENDLSDPDYGPPETWGLWADRDQYEIGPDLDVDPDLYRGLAGEDEPIIDADDMMLDMIERMTLERETCTARFV